MANDKNSLIDQLRRAGISRAAIDAAWPAWWTEEAESSPSGRAELRFALARRLGLEAKPLLGERVEFIWNDEAMPPIGRATCSIRTACVEFCFGLMSFIISLFLSL